MSKFKVFLSVGLGVGVIAGGTVALFTSGKKQAPPSTREPAPAAIAPPSPGVNTPAPASSASATSAIAPTEQVASARGGDPEALNERGKTELFAGRFVEAEPLFRRAFELDPQPKYGFNLATALFQQGKHDDALGTLAQLRTLDLAPELRAKVEKLLLTVVDDCNQGRPPCAALGASAPPSKGIRASTLNDEGKGLLLAGKYGAATRKFRDAFTLVTNPKYLFNLATSLFQEGKFAEAITALDAMPKFEAGNTQLELAGKLRARVVDECKAQGLDCR